MRTHEELVRLNKNELVDEVIRLEAKVEELNARQVTSRRRSGIEVDGVVLADGQSKSHAMSKLASRSKANLARVIPLRLKVLGHDSVEWRYIEQSGKTPKVEIKTGEQFEIWVGTGDWTDYYLLPVETGAVYTPMATENLPDDLVPSA